MTMYTLQQTLPARPYREMTPLTYSHDKKSKQHQPAEAPDRSTSPEDGMAV